MNDEGIQASCAAIRVRPTWILAASGAVGIAIHAVSGWRYTSDPQLEQWLAWVGYPVVACGGLLLVLAGRQFARHGTDSDCGAPDTALIRTGPYRVSRNPIYLSFAVIFAGCSLTANAPGLAALAVPMLAALHRFVVLPEERHLETVFGTNYQAYARRVRRWV